MSTETAKILNTETYAIVIIVLAIITAIIADKWIDRAYPPQPTITAPK